MIKKIVLVLVFLILGVLAYAALQPDAMHVQREVVVKAPPGKIFPFVNDFHSWNIWSSYDKLDPAMERTYSGAPTGLGAAYAWSGNSDVGQGRMEITDSTQPARIVIKLDFIKPFEGHNIATFTFTPEGDSTRVRWAMDGPSPYVAKLMGVFVDMDTMIGKDFETGLATLKAVAEN